MLKTVWTLFLFSSLLTFGCGYAEQPASQPDSPIIPTDTAAVRDNNETSVNGHSETAAQTKPNQDRSLTAGENSQINVTAPNITKDDKTAAKTVNKTKIDDKLERVNRRVGEIINSQKGALKKERQRLKEGFDKVISDAAIKTRLP